MFLFTRLRAAAMIAELWLMLCLASALIRLLPYRRYAPLVQRMNGASDTPVQVARRVRRRLDLAVRCFPRSPKCLTRAIASRALLGRRGYASSLSLGVDASAPTLAAHAWLTAGGIIVTGREEMANYGEVARM